MNAQMRSDQAQRKKAGREGNTLMLEHDLRVLKCIIIIDAKDKSIMYSSLMPGAHHRSTCEKNSLFVML